MLRDLHRLARMGWKSAVGSGVAGTQPLSVAALFALSFLCAGPLSDPFHARQADAQSLEGRIKAKPAQLAVDRKNFREGFHETTNVSSSVLAGLTLGGEKGDAQIDQVIIGAAGLPEAGSFCLHVTSRDGQFWSENPFLAPADSKFWSVRDISVKHRQQIAKEYRIRDVFIAAGLVPSTKGAGGAPATAEGAMACTRKKVVYAPTIAFEADRAGPLRAYVNSEGRYTEAELWSGGKLAYTGVCNRPPTGATVVFDQVCKFDFAGIPAAGLYELKLFFDAPPFGTEPWTGEVALPGNFGQKQ